MKWPSEGGRMISLRTVRDSVTRISYVACSSRFPMHLADWDLTPKFDNSVPS